MKRFVVFVLVLFLIVTLMPLKAQAKSTLPKIEIVKGSISAISDNTITIDKKVIKIKDDTALRLNGIKATISDIKVGMHAIAVCETIDKDLVARLVLVFNGNLSSKTFTVVGEITSITQNAVVVSGKTIIVNDQTKIRLQGKLVSFSELKVGDRVVVHGDYSQDVYIAKEILILNHKEFEMRSYITEIGSNFLKIKDFDYQIFVNDKTSITKVGKGKISFSDLKVSDPVQIHVRLDKVTGNYFATSIVVLSFKPNTAVAIAGTVSFIDLETKTIKLSELPLLTFKFPQDYKGKVMITDLNVNDKILVLGKYINVNTVEITNIIRFKIKLSVPKKP
ncbi:DUF5666 domain-containing protein [Caldisericum exile]|uniref:DUF5666 domain-containing protein n=1 Tax=Caldisericum exile TaxID=693075 RepID=UPI003C724624